MSDTMDDKALEYVQQQITQFAAFANVSGGLTEHGKGALDALRLMLHTVWEQEFHEGKFIRRRDLP